MNVVLTDTEARVLGTLIEKSLATPDQYPLSLAGLTTGCNQKSNRDPVTTLSEPEVREAADSLIAKHMARERSPAGSRVPKFSHRLADSLGLSFSFSQRELGVLSVLMLRGPQTPGELRNRTNRLCHFDNVQQVDDTLNQLAAAERGPYARELPRQPGQRESRHVHLFCGEPSTEELSRTQMSPLPAASPDDREQASLATQFRALEDRVELLELELAELRERITGQSRGV